MGKVVTTNHWKKSANKADLEQLSLKIVSHPLHHLWPFVLFKQLWVSYVSGRLENKKIFMEEWFGDGGGGEERGCVTYLICHLLQCQVWNIHPKTTSSVIFSSSFLLYLVKMLIFKALRADAFYKSICLSVCPSVYVCVHFWGTV